MAFQLKTFYSIAGSMLNHIRGVQAKITDFNPGSVARTLVEAPGVEIDELYQRVFDGIRQAIPVATFNSFNFDALPANAATGVIHIVVTSSAAARLISAGAVFQSPSARTKYVSLVDVTIAAGATNTDLLVRASDTGVVGNLAAGAAFTVYPTISGMVSATNTAAFTNGADEESADQRKQRFARYVTTLQRGTVAAIKYGAKTVRLYDATGAETERVATAAVIEPYEVDPGSNDPGYINVYIHNGVGSTSSELIARALEVIKGYTDASTGKKVAGWKAAGVSVTVAAATEAPVDVTASLTALPGYSSATLAPLAAAAISEYIASVEGGDSYLEAEAVYRVKSIEGVYNITGLPADQASTESQKLMPGTVTVTAA